MAHSTKGWEPSVAFPSISGFETGKLILSQFQSTTARLSANKVTSSKVKPKSLHESITKGSGCLARKPQTVGWHSFDL